MHLVPVKLFHSVQEFPQDDSVVVVAPTMQQIEPAPPSWNAVQSIASEHCQSTSPLGQAVPAGWQDEGPAEADGDSQQCSPAAQLSLPASAGRKGQYTPGAVCE